MAKQAFDPNKPYTVVSMPGDHVSPVATNAHAFDPNKPYTVVSMPTNSDYPTVPTIQSPHHGTVYNVVHNVLQDARAVAAGGIDTVSMGMGDWMEAKAAEYAKMAKDKLQRNSQGGYDAYFHKVKDQLHATDVKLAKNHPFSYTGGQVAGLLMPTGIDSVAMKGIGATYKFAKKLPYAGAAIKTVEGIPKQLRAMPKVANAIDATANTVASGLSKVKGIIDAPTRYMSGKADAIGKTIIGNLGEGMIPKALVGVKLGALAPRTAVDATTMLVGHVMGGMFGAEAALALKKTIIDEYMKKVVRNGVYKRSAARAAATIPSEVAAEKVVAAWEKAKAKLNNLEATINIPFVKDAPLTQRLASIEEQKTVLADAEKQLGKSSYGKRILRKTKRIDKFRPITADGSYARFAPPMDTRLVKRVALRGLGSMASTQYTSKKKQSQQFSDRQRDPALNQQLMNKR